ncbi:hypothetical protein IGS73_14790 [Janibacter indicus]|uniref:Uncharacterized protein n=1 Tax=Janibacter indicus TaxID=857417 RepID=A0A7L9IY84_9MICO|nr:hypothetical protein [Janibacter indicus]QOK22336.1 hypothetical protein IGS73_14790 [Janibacter indicus]
MREQTTTYWCDLCGWGGPLSRSEDFTTTNVKGIQIDLCAWCRDPGPLVWIECGGHTVTADEEAGWTCTCGASYARPRADPLTLEAVPDLLKATASMHAEGRGVDRLP